MRNATLAAYATLFLTPAVFAAPPTTQPGDFPPPREIVPPTQPAPAEVGTVLIVPLAESGGTSHPWLSRAIQQDMMVELGPTTRAHIDAPTSIRPATDSQSALEAGRNANASLVIFGQYQVTGDHVLITGQVLDVKTTKPAGIFSANGSMNNLFPLEDSVNSQILRELPPTWLTVALPPTTQNAQSGAEPYVAPPAVVPAPQTPLPQYYSYTYPDYAGPAPGYAYEYGVYPYYYGYDPYFYYGPSIWFFGGGDFFHHHHFHHGWDDGHAWHGHNFGGGSHGFSHSGAGGSHSSGGSHGGGGGSHGGGGGHR